MSTRWSRGIVALGLVLAWSSLGQVQRVEGAPFAPFGEAFFGALVTPAVGVLASAGFVAACVCFVVDRRADVGAGVMLGLLAAGAQLQAWQWPPGLSPNGAVVLPGAALAAWWIARRLVPAASAEASGVEAASGVVAASYPLAGASKLLGSGLAWAGGGNVGLHIAAHSFAGAAWLQPLRLAAATSPWFCTVLGVGTLVIELGAILFVIPAARPWVAGAVVSMHLGISLLMGLHHYDWMFTTVGLALASRGDRR